MSTFGKKAGDFNLNNDIEIYADDIDLALAEYVETRNIEDERKMTSSMWAACMQFIGDRLFKNGNLLRGKNQWNNNPYDLDKVLALVDKYSFLCRDHNQRICQAHFCLLSGVDRTTINLWANELRRSGDPRAKKIYETLMENGMTAAEDIALSKSGINSIAYANNYREKYNEYKGKQKDNSVLNMDSLAVRLGISADLQALPDKGKPAGGLLEADTDKYPWMALPDDADLDMDI